MEKVQFVDEIGEDNFFNAKEDAINIIYEQLDQNKCANCQALIFRECQ